MITGDLSATLRLWGAWRTLLQRFASMLMGETLARVFGVVALLVLTRNLRPAGFGLISFGMTLVLWCALLVDAGTEMHGLRSVARDPQRFRVIAEPVLGLRLALSAVASALLCAVVAIAAHSASDRTVLWLFVLVLPVMAMNLRWMVLGVDAARAIAVGNVVGQVVFAGGVLLLVADQHGALYVPLLQGLDELVSAGFILYAVGRRFGFVRPRIDLAVWRRSVGSGWPLFVNNLSRTIVYSFDVLFIGVVLQREAVGYYNAAYRPILLFVTVLALLSVTFLASYSAASGQEREALFRRTVMLAGVTSVPLAVVITGFAGPAVTLAYGHAYHPAAAPLAILVWVVAVLAIGTPYANVLLAADRERVLMRNNLVGALLNVVANLAAVPLFGLVGAAAVTLASEVVIFALNGRAVAAAGLAQPTRDVLRDFLGAHLRPRLARTR